MWKGSRRKDAGLFPREVSTPAAGGLTSPACSGPASLDVCWARCAPPLGLCRRHQCQPARFRDKIGDLWYTQPRLYLREHERPRTAHTPGVTVLHFEARADQRREVGFVDDEQIAF